MIADHFCIGEIHRDTKTGSQRNDTTAVHQQFIRQIGRVLQVLMVDKAIILAGFIFRNSVHLKKKGHGFPWPLSYRYVMKIPVSTYC